jgi:hypothetical protein
MALKWAKEVLGSAYTEELEKKIETQINGEYATRAELETATTNEEALKKQLKDAQDTLQGLDGKGVEAVKKEAADYKQRAEQAEKDRDEKLAEMRFESMLDGLIVHAKGRDVQTVKPVLDIATLRTSKNQEADIKAALDAAKKSHAYLFEGAAAAEPGTANDTGDSARSTGSGAGAVGGLAASVAAALATNKS